MTYDPNDSGPDPDLAADDNELFTPSVWEEIQGERDMRVRRLLVPGGWLYQVEHHQHMEPVEHTPGHHVYGWHPPVFVPNPSIRVAARKAGR